MKIVKNNKILAVTTILMFVGIIGIVYADFTDNLKFLIFQLFFSSKLLLSLINLLFFQRFINKRKIENAIRNINNEMEESKKNIALFQNGKKLMVHLPHI